VVRPVALTSTAYDGLVLSRGWLPVHGGAPFRAVPLNKSID